MKARVLFHAMQLLSVGPHLRLTTLWTFPATLCTRFPQPVQHSLSQALHAGFLGEQLQFIKSTFIAFTKKQRHFIGSNNLNLRKAQVLGTLAVNGSSHSVAFASQGETASLSKRPEGMAQRLVLSAKTEEEENAAYQLISQV